MSDVSRYHQLQDNYQKTFLAFNSGVLIATLTFIETTDPKNAKSLVETGLTFVFLSVFLLILELFIMYITYGSEAFKLIDEKKASNRGIYVYWLMLWGLSLSIMGTILIAVFVMINI